MTGCSSVIHDKNTQTTNLLSDKKASVETIELYQRLSELIPKGILFGHQDATVYGNQWVGDSDRSDVKEVCGDYPAVLGWDIGHLEIGKPTNLDEVSFERMRREIITHHKRGGINTVSWHSNNPVTFSDSWDVSHKYVVDSILSGASCEKRFKAYLDNLTVFFKSLQTEDGTVVPILFRPYHEHTGSWFWWGKDHCSEDSYKALWRMTHDYFTENGVHNLIYVYSPSFEPTKEGYLERYPGDDYVDILGFDIYQYEYDKEAVQYTEMMNAALKTVSEIASERNKLMAVTETGYESIPDSTWWTNVLSPVIDPYPVSYVLLWRNAHDKPNHHYAPYPGHPSESDFKRFASQPRRLFNADIHAEK